MSFQAPISAIIPCYCSSETIEIAVKSILAQSVAVGEIILVDDCSEDDTINVMHELVNKYGSVIKVLKLPKNSGPGHARNVGWDFANEPWIAFLDADDAWHPLKIEMQWNWIKSHPQAVLVGHATKLFNGEVDDLILDKVTAKPISLLQMLVSNRFPTRSVIMRKDLPFRFIDDRCEDYFLWLEIISSGYQAWRINLPLAYSFRDEYSPGGFSSRLWDHEKGEIRALYKLHLNKRISFPLLICASLWSFLKFLRRLFRNLLSIPRD